MIWPEGVSLVWRKGVNLRGFSNQAYQVLGLDKKTVEPILDQSAKTVDVLNIIKIAEFLSC